MKTYAMLAAILFLLILPGCGIIKTQKVERGHDISSGDLNTLEKGKSTERDVLKIFGPPTKVRDTQGGKEFMYEYAKSGGPRWDLGISVGGSSVTKTLIIWIDQKGIVEDYAFKRS